jgi:hypothetical protein
VSDRLLMNENYDNRIVRNRAGDEKSLRHCNGKSLSEYDSVVTSILY